MTNLEIEIPFPGDTAPHAASPEPQPKPVPETYGLLPKFCAGLGLFLLILGIYLLTSPGRIDTIDGQARFDVAYNLVVRGRPILTDSWLGEIVGVPGRGGYRYSYYGAPASVFAAPLVWLALKFHPLTIMPVHFMFSLTSSIFGAGIAPLLFLFYLHLGVSLRRAVLWTLVSSFATLVWPLSNSAFDNSQNAFFALAALYCAFLSAKRNSRTLAIAGGLFAGVLILYQEYFLLLVPCLAYAALDWKPQSEPAVTTPAASRQSALDRADAALKRALRSAQERVRQGWDAPGKERSSCVRYALFVAAAAVGMALTLAYNDLRFGSWLNNGKGYYAGAFPVFGNPIMGLLTLLASPGKSIFFYSPPIILGIFGFAQLRSRTPVLARAVVACSVVLISFLSCISFAGGDWCWGPRYLVPLLPFLDLSFPFAKFKLRREVILFVVALGLLVQILALSVENERFFNEQAVNDYFWAESPTFYLTHSALFTRFGEVASLREGLPATARLFSSVPYPTYSVLGAPQYIPRRSAAAWIRNYQIFFLPRPWPLWMAYLEPSMRPIDAGKWLLGLTGSGLLGVSLVFLGLRPKEQT